MTRYLLPIILCACGPRGQKVPRDTVDTDIETPVQVEILAGAPSAAGRLAVGSWLGDAVVAWSATGEEWDVDRVEGDEAVAVARWGIRWAVLVHGDGEAWILSGQPGSWAEEARFDNASCTQLASDGVYLVTDCGGGTALDGTDTEAVSVGNATELSFASGVWLAFVPDTGLLRSEDALTWRPVAADPTTEGEATALFYDGGQWRVPVHTDSGDFIASALDGDSFSSSPADDAPTDLQPFAGEWFGASGGLVVSPDLRSWEPIYDLETRALLLGEERIIALGSGLRSSTDGRVWVDAEVSLPAPL